MSGLAATQDGSADGTSSTVRVVELPEDPAGRVHSAARRERRPTRIVLLTPYTGGNLGDAAIQDAVVANLRRQIPDVEFSGITLNCENFLKRHGSKAFPLVGTGIPFFRMDEKWVPDVTGPGRGFLGNGRTRAALRQLPGAKALKLYLKRILLQVRKCRQEVDHWVAGYRFLRTHDLLLFSGGGQLDDNYGGPWGLPYALFKWALLARMARVPCAMASVGVGIVNSDLSRRLLSVALRLCVYRSFRETRSRDAATSMSHRSIDDPVVPDLALSLADSDLPPIDGSVHDMAGGRPIVALSPMAFAKPVNWPAPDRKLHDRYVRELAQVLSQLCNRDYFVIIVCSSRGDDESVIPEILQHFDERLRAGIQSQIYSPRIESWRELVSTLRSAEYLIASRLHGTIFGFLTGTPVIAISFASKVDWVLEYLHQSEYRLDIRNFTAEDVISTMDRIKAARGQLVKQIAAHRDTVLSSPTSGRQYALLARLASAHRQSEN